MAIIFYDHLINKEEVIVLIDESPDPENTKHRAKQLVDDVIHQEIIGFILERLDTPKHRTFLTLVDERPFDPEIILYLRDHVGPTIETDLEQFANDLIRQIKRDFLLPK